MDCRLYSIMYFYNVWIRIKKSDKITSRSYGHRHINAHLKSVEFRRFHYIIKGIVWVNFENVHFLELKFVIFMVLETMSENINQFGRMIS